MIPGCVGLRVDRVEEFVSVSVSDVSVRVGRGWVAKTGNRNRPVTTWFPGFGERVRAEEGRAGGGS